MEGEEGGSRFRKEDEIESRIDSLLESMTLEEKIGQLNQEPGFSEITGPIGNEDEDLDMGTESIPTVDEAEIRNGRVGSVLNVTGVEKIRELQEFAVENSRLGIPLLFGYDSLHGHRTIFPIPLGETASWDMDLIERTSRITAKEASALGLNWNFGPMVDISRDPRWGRVMEGAGEDPYLGAKVSQARVGGYQADSLKEVDTIAACPKYFAGYGFVEAGRDYNTVDVSLKTLREEILPPFKSSVVAGACTVMNSFSAFRGIPPTGNPLFGRILKDEWDFDGFLVSDWNSVGELVPHGVAEDRKKAAEMAIKAGCDMDMISMSYKSHLKQLVEEGKVEESRINDAVRRILRVKFKLGLFDDPYKYCSEEREEEIPLKEEHRKVAREAGRKSIVLFKNEDDILPLSRGIDSLAVVGPLADDPDAPLGEWRAGGDPEDTVTLLEGLRRKLTDTEINYSRGCEIDDEDIGEKQAQMISKAFGAVAESDVAVVAVGEKAEMSGEYRSRGNIDLPGIQRDFLKELQNTDTPLIMVLMNGRPLAIEWAGQNVPAILETWLLGTEAGNSIADVLLGDYNPSGKLPMTFPRCEGQIPIYYRHLNTGRPKKSEDDVFASRYIDIPNEPLYHFGHGLSYTDFEYSEISLSNKRISKDDTLEVEISVANSGDISGSEVVQLYIRDLVASVSRPIKELKGFRRVDLDPGEKEDLVFEITSDDLAFWNDEPERVIESGEFKVMIGSSSKDIRSEEKFELI